jgi:head-tail adaptor
MVAATQRRELITFLAASESTNDYNEVVDGWANPSTLATRNARVKFGTAQEKREAAQEAASQTATFECHRSPELDAIPTTARIGYDGSQWDITAREPLSKADIRFTGVRLL